MPVVNDLFAGICQRTAHKGMAAMLVRTEREAAGLDPVAAPAAQADSVGGALTSACGLSALSFAALGLGCCLLGVPRLRPRPSE
mmetsp:Transcript_19542/g.39748  ORF Transcript_19542/g.39748 Transcript_19542/m.39748 type:complete len:84 (+) Transcript_19542:10-261(+)